MSKLDRTVAPFVHDTADISLLSEQIVTLATGVKLHLLDQDSQNLVRLSLLWEGGTLDMPLQAIPMVLASALSEGSRKYSGAEIADIIDFAGARVTPRISEHFTGIELISLASCYDRLLPVIEDMIVAPLLSDDTIAMMTARAAAKLSTTMAKATYPVNEAIDTIIHGEGHPAARTTTPEHIEALTRDDIVSAYDMTVGSGRLHVFLCGSLTAAIVDSTIAMLNNLPAPAGKSAIVVVPDTPMLPRRVVIERPGDVQAAVCMGMPAIKRDHPDYIPLRLSVMALGGYFSSRLMTNIREDKGLTYGISSYLMGSYEGASVRIGAQCDVRYVDRVIDETFKEIEAMVSRPVDGAELHRLRLYGFNSLAAITDSPFSIMDYYITALVVGTGLDYFNRQLDVLRSLTSDQLRQVFIRHIDPSRFSVASTTTRR